MYYDVVIIGAGISGLTAAIEASKSNVKSVLLVEFQSQIGGMQASLFQHSSFAEEKKLIEEAKSLSYEVWNQSTVIGFFPGDVGQNHQLYIQKKTGTETVEAKAVIIASGSLQQPREAFKISGSRPFGVMTSLLAKNLLESGFLPGEDIVLFERTRVDTAVREELLKAHLKVRSLPFDDYKLLKVHGVEKVSSITVERNSTGVTQELPCDSLVYSAGRIPSTFFLKQTPVERNQHLAVLVDEDGRTSVPNIFAIGSCTDRGDDDHLTSRALSKKVISHILKILEGSQIN